MMNDELGMRKDEGKNEGMRREERGMEEMREAGETVADIVADLRREHRRFSDEDTFALADRLEAAEKRQSDAVSLHAIHAIEMAVREARREMDGLKKELTEQKMLAEAMAYYKPGVGVGVVTIEEAGGGNVAELRTAIREAIPWLAATVAEVTKSARPTLNKCKAALNAPARNCDRAECQTSGGVVAALRKHRCADQDFCKGQTDCAVCAAMWLMAKAENENDGVE
jgi:hypothetical protein